MAKKCYLLIKVGRCKTENTLLFVTKCIHINETTAGISVFFYRNLLNVFECSSLTLWKCTVAYTHIYNSNVCALMMVRIFSTDFFVVVVVIFSLLFALVITEKIGGR